MTRRGLPSAVRCWDAVASGMWMRCGAPATCIDSLPNLGLVPTRPPDQARQRNKSSEGQPRCGRQALGQPAPALLAPQPDLRLGSPCPIYSFTLAYVKSVGVRRLPGAGPAGLQPLRVVVTLALLCAGASSPFHSPVRRMASRGNGTPMLDSAG